LPFKVILNLRDGGKLQEAVSNEDGVGLISGILFLDEMVA
jgi:hypothetical protein